MNKFLPLYIAELMSSSCVKEIIRRKARVFMSVVVAAVCVAFTSSCDKEQSQEDDKFDVEFLGKESKVMVEIDGKPFSREFIFTRPKSSLNNDGQDFLFAGEFFKGTREYTKVTIKLSQDSPITVGKEYCFDGEKNYCEVKVLSETSSDPDYGVGSQLRTYIYYVSLDGSIEFLKIENDRIWAKFEFSAKDLPDGETIEITNGYLVNIPTS